MAEPLLNASPLALMTIAWATVAVVTVALLAVVLVRYARKLRHSLRRRRTTGPPPERPRPRARPRRAGRRGSPHEEAREDLLYERSAEDEAFTEDLIQAVSGELGPSPLIERTSKPERYANVTLLDTRGSRVQALAPASTARLRVDIAALRDDSLVGRPVGFPDDVLPAHDVCIRVLFSSSDFGVGLDLDALRHGIAVERKLLLPADGGAARAPDGAPHVDFVLRAPDRLGPARARLSYFYRGTLLQSQRLDAWLGQDELTVTTDFTVSRALGADLDSIAKRPRVTVLMNESRGGLHELTVRASDGDGAPLGPGVSFQLPHARIGAPVRRLRAGLEQVAPQRPNQNRAQLIATLRALAPLGWDLYNALDPSLQDAVRDLASARPTAVLQVALAQGATFTLPWSFVYDVYLPSGIGADRLALCESVAQWDGRSPLVRPDQRSCPYAAEPSHREAVLCPFGFWGYRYAIELLTSTERPATSIRCRQGGEVAVGETSRGVPAADLADHLQRLATTFAQCTAGGLRLRRASTAHDLRTLIEADLPFLYFLCHGEHDGQSTLLALGRDDRISPKDLIGWIDVAAHSGRHMWRDPQPFVFLNACGSLGIAPEDLIDYLGAFVGKGRAVGMIGTEARVELHQAMQLAESFFAKLLAPSTTVEQALRHVRNEFLSEGNLFGLTYTPYCFADLAVTTIAARSPSVPAEAA